MLSATDANLLRSKVHKAILNIGKTNGTKMPATKSNTEAVALQYWLWTHVSKMVEVMRKGATAEALKAGVLFDHTKEPLDAGTEKLIYRSDSVIVSVKVANPSTRVDVDMLIRELRKAGIKQEVLDKAVEASSKENRPPHYFTANLVEKPE